MRFTVAPTCGEMALAAMTSWSLISVPFCETCRQEEEEEEEEEEKKMKKPPPATQKRQEETRLE